MFEVRKIDARSWSEMSREAHLIVFGKHKPAEWDRVDFALLVVRADNDEIMGYATCREFDHETLYLQHGGSFPGARSTSLSLLAYLAIIKWCKTYYKRITTLVENDNFVYMKFAMKAGLKIIGIRVFNRDQVLLEHIWEAM